MRNHDLSLKRKVDERLRRVANVLLLNASFIDNIGLLNGKMGIAIFFYHYSRYTNNKMFDDFAGELIDEIYEEIKITTPVDFANGLTGIGWGIEYLVRNNYVQADTDEALSEIDNALYRARINSPILINDGKDLFGYGHYYIKRLTGKEINDDDLNTLIKKYHLIFLTDECESILLHDYYKGFNIESLSVNTINSFIWFLIEMQRLGIIPFKSEKILQVLPDFIDASLKHYDDIAGICQMHKLTGYILPYINDPVTRDFLTKLLNSNLFEENHNTMSDESAVDSFVKNTWQQIVFEPYVVMENEPGNYFNKVFLVIDNEENWIKRLDNINNSNMGLTGLAGLGLGLLRAQSSGQNLLEIEHYAVRKKKRC